MQTSDSRITLALVFDSQPAFFSKNKFSFPVDATAEWESDETIEKISNTWKCLGMNVLKLPVDNNFFENWNRHKEDIHVVHSLVEGWGSAAREGWIPSLCELAGIPYIGSSPTAMNIAMQKSTTKIICKFLNINTPEFYFIQSMEDLSSIPKSFFDQTLFIKPDAEGSGMGVDVAHSICKNENEVKTICKNLLIQYPDGVLLEEYIDSTEYTSALVGNPLEHFPIAQIDVDTGVYGLSNKSKSHMGERVSFPKLPGASVKQIQDGGLKLSRYLGFEDFVRLDWKAKSDGRIYFLEANPLAGLSYYYSVLPKMAYEAGYSYEELLKKLGDAALKKARHRRYWYGGQVTSQ